MADQEEGTFFGHSPNRCLSPSHTPVWAGLGPRVGKVELGTTSGPPTNNCQHFTRQCHGPSRSSALPLPGPAPSCPCASHPHVEGRGSHGERRELCLLRPHRLQCQRKRAFKGHFWLGRPARPQIQNKNRSGAPDGLVSPAPWKGLIEPKGQAARGRTGQGTPASGHM